MRLTPDRKSALSWACIAAAFFGLCLAVQGLSGSWSASFLGYPDEPSHFVGSVMVRDWLASGRWLQPFQFAQNYYDHYPYFAIGYWPPLFSVVTGLWLLVAGVGRPQALLVPAVFAAGTAWLIARFVRQRSGMALGVCAGVLYLSLPVVRQWICAVMVDHVTAFLCIAAAFLLLRYLKGPGLWNGTFCAVLCGCAVLSKYSAAYIVVLPFIAIVILRRFELLRKPSFLVQPLIVALIAGPWILWTRRLAFYGLPSEREALTATRAWSFLLAAFRIFPPVLLAVVVLGLIALLVRPKAWREEFVVLGLLCAGHLTLLIVSPVGPEARYVLVPAAVFLIVSFAGWTELLRVSTSKSRQIAGVAWIVFTVLFVSWQFSHLAQVPQDGIRSVAALVMKEPAPAGRRIVVPSGLEGPTIAELVAQSRNRPNDYTLRPSKILAHADWFGRNYASLFATPAQMMEYFQQHPVNLIVLNESMEASPQTHERIMDEMLREYPLSWREKALSRELASRGWTTYEYVPPDRNLTANQRP